MNRRIIFIFIGIFVFAILIRADLLANTYEVFSPDKKIQLKVEIGQQVLYSVFLESQEILAPSPISMTIKDKGKLGFEPVLESASQRSIDREIRPVIRAKSAVIKDIFNEISLKFENSFDLIFRVYDDGVAYRFQTSFDGNIDVLDEEVIFNFGADHQVYFPTEESFFTHQERLYEYLSLTQITRYKMCSPPALVDIKDGPKIAITEADLEDYAGLYLTGRGRTSLRGIFPAVALEERQTRDRDVRIVKRDDHIARTGGRRSFPWRVLIIAKKDADLLENLLVYKLAKPLQLQDTNWIKSGKVAWDWWNANNIHGVDFEAGINSETYKYYIDFASAHDIEYIILDEGWYRLGNLFDINPEIDIEEIIRYAQEKNVGIILWVVWKTLDNQLHDALNQFEKWGVKGIKVDFMQRDDQWMVNYYHKIAKEAAKRHLLVDFHGAYKPTGLRRAYPNVLTREGVLGLEHNKWSKNVTPEHNVILPFIRMLAGPMDYTPGAMINAQEKNFQVNFTRPMSMGTRCHQLAMYVVYESPLQMLADSPSHYLKEKECLEFLSKVPCVWDETHVLNARVADFILMARKSGEEWYLGAMTDGTARELLVDMSFLPEGEFDAEIFEDGMNAQRYGNDYKKNVISISNKKKLNIKLAPGGGWVARIYLKKKE
ncbi:MAG: glycoside hydrolase family 97 protein [Candidatus Aminicenantes bacterium]|nr:MAG: glycoside hydrolase family 97 protein [Candidatus Aminicenantes bacterium]